MRPVLPTSFTAVLERSATFGGPFTTEPYEVAWAHEARFFVRVLGHDPGASISVRTQVSPDGLHWCDLDADDRVVDPATCEVHTWTAREFGGWLRVRGVASAGTVKAHVYLALKA